jgi:hypothetical protein
MPTTSTPSVVDVLTKARELIATKGWTQNAWARTADGRGLRVRDGHLAEDELSGATCFCLRGAIAAVTGNADHSAQNYLLQAVGMPEEWHAYLADWNDDDDRTADDVLAIYDKAISLASAEGQ